MTQRRRNSVSLRGAILCALSLIIMTAGSAIAQTPAPAACSDMGNATISRTLIVELYDGRAATGIESRPIVDLLEQYGLALTSGELDSITTVITADYDKEMRFSDCSSLLEGASEDPEFLYTPLRVTTDGNGTWLGFVQRSFDDGSEEGYRDVFMVVVVEDEELGLLIDFAHRDIVFENGEMTSAEDIYLNGIAP